MADVTVKRFDELESYKNEGHFNYAARTLGVTAWGMNLLKLPPAWPDYPDHDHAKDGQEEVYVIIEGDATLHAGGETWKVLPGTFVRVGPQQKRKFVPGPKGVTIVALGGTPGKAYEPKKR
jgi:mannose-6-phosphate isomerase-like protein (cupin superfamily)